MAKLLIIYSLQKKWKIFLPFMVAGILMIVGMGFIVKRYDGRPICMPQLPPRGDDPPLDLPAFNAPDTIPIPTQDDWVDYGPVLETGQEGEWDFFWAGLTPASVVKKDGIYYFYYVAADGYRSHDGDARHRSIGVATSPDGIRFTKYTGNPIMTHRPYDGEEEGANSAGVTLDDDGRFVMVYGAAKGPYDLIVADGRFAYSDDGFTFSDAGRALYHCNVRLYGWGDEIFPIAIFQNESRWFVFYQPNGIPGTARTLGVAWGPSLNRLNNSTRVLGAESGGLPVDTWGNIIQLDDDTLVFFNQRLWWPDTYVEVRAASPQTPYHLSEPVVRYEIPNLKRGVVFLDKERRTWFMYYNDFSRYWHVKLAPYGAVDETPPTIPSQLVGYSLAHDSIHLKWEAAYDLETGVAEYRIYRDGKLVGTTQQLEWVDHDLKELSKYQYSVTAVNFHGKESSGDGINVNTPADLSPPAIISVEMDEALDQVIVNFNKRLDHDIFSDTNRYAINNGIVIYQVTLNDDGKTVVLTTSDHTPGSLYTLSFNYPLASNEGHIAKSNNLYTASPVRGLVGRWLLSEFQSDIVHDLSGFGQDGRIYGEIMTGSEGIGLHFDGSISALQIPGAGSLQSLTDNSFSMTAMIRPESEPSSPHGARIFMRVGAHPAYYFGLSLKTDGRIEARVFHPDESTTRLRSEQLDLSKWYHVAMTLDVDAEELRLYLDGEPVSASPRKLGGDLARLWADSPRDDRSGAYFIGSSMPDRGAGTFYDAYFHGSLADLRLYNRALNHNEVLQIFHEWQP
jgi:hypothetical protein